MKELNSIQLIVLIGTFIVLFGGLFWIVFDYFKEVWKNELEK